MGKDVKIQWGSFIKFAEGAYDSTLIKSCGEKSQPTFLELCRV